MTSPYASRGQSTMQLSQEAHTFNWLLDSFTSSTAGVVEAIAVSSDGLLMAMSAVKDRSNAERLAAVVSGMTRPPAGAGRPPPSPSVPRGGAAGSAGTG